MTSSPTAPSSDRTHQRSRCSRSSQEPASARLDGAGWPWSSAATPCEIVFPSTSTCCRSRQCGDHQSSSDRVDLGAVCSAHAAPRWAVWPASHARLLGRGRLGPAGLDQLARLRLQRQHRAHGRRRPGLLHQPAVTVAPGTAGPARAAAPVRRVSIACWRYRRGTLVVLGARLPWSPRPGASPSPCGLVKENGSGPGWWWTPDRADGGERRRAPIALVYLTPGLAGQSAWQAPASLANRSAAQRGGARDGRAPAALRRRNTACAVVGCGGWGGPAPAIQFLLAWVVFHERADRRPVGRPWCWCGRRSRKLAIGDAVHHHSPSRLRQTGTRPETLKADH